MSKEKVIKDSGESRKKILLGVLLLAMIVVIYVQFFSGDSGPSPSGAATTAGNRTPTPPPTPRPLPIGQKPEPIISQPLQLAWFSRNISGEGTGRNIFVYPTPTPAPPPPPVPVVPPPPPPPILLSSVNPSGVIGRTSDFVMTLHGDKIPADGQGFLDGRPYESKFINPNELRVQVPSEAIRNSGNLGVQIRSRADAALYSNQLSLNVAEPPPPNYRFIGLITSKNGMIAVLKLQGDDGEVFNVVKGQKFGTHWRVSNITSQKIEVEDINLPLPGGRYINHTINFSGEGN
ncbi:MAG: hypothetical protein M3X11_06520 [Acidobacteriota bacterium]|nr:hypothetical protein [Acidobacteriota bacterium]